MQNRTKGIITGVSSYILWGVLGLYWSLLKEVTALDILGYRFIFSLVFYGGYFVFSETVDILFCECQNIMAIRKNYLGHFKFPFHCLKLGNLYLYGWTWSSH